MIQNQYYNHKLTKSQIEKILKNYDIKYITMKNEIDAKFNILIKEFVIDIKKFLDKNEEIVNERKKIKEAENIQMEIELLKSQLEEKVLNENKLQSEIDNLTKENESLKKRIKIQTNISKSKNANRNANISDLNSTNSSILKSETRSIKNRYKKIYNTQQNKDINNKDKKNIKSKIIKTETNKNMKNVKKRNNNHLSNSIEKRTLKDVENLKSASVKFKDNRSNSTGKRNINNYKNINAISNNKKIKNKNKKNNSINKTPENKSMTVNNTTGNNSNSNLNSKNNKTIENEKKMNLSEINPFDQSVDEDDSLITVDDVIDEEIKELEMDEENIILLMEQIKNFKNGNEELN